MLPCFLQIIRQSAHLHLKKLRVFVYEGAPEYMCPQFFECFSYVPVCTYFNTIKISLKYLWFATSCNLTQEIASEILWNGRIRIFRAFMINICPLWHLLLWWRSPFGRVMKLYYLTFARLFFWCCWFINGGPFPTTKQYKGNKNNKLGHINTSLFADRGWTRRIHLQGHKRPLDKARS